MQHFTAVASSGSDLTVSRGFAIQAIRVDNFTNQWLQVVGQFSFIRPYTYGEVIALGGAGAVTLSRSVPQGAFTQSHVIAGEQYTVTIYDIPLPAQPGIVGQIKQDTYVADNGFSYSVALAAPGAVDVLPSTIAGTIEGLTGASSVRRIGIKTLSTNVDKVFVVIAPGVIPSGSQGIELGPSESIALAYPWCRNPATAGNNVVGVPTQNQSWAQFWFNAAADIARVILLFAP